MMEKLVFEDLLNETDRAVIKKGGYGKRRGFGSHPLLLIMNLQPFFLGENKPVLDQLERYPYAAGEDGWLRLERILQMRDAARKAGIPIIYTRKISDCDCNISGMGRNTAFKRALHSSHPDSQLLPCVFPLTGELMVEMSGESAFFGTPLESYITKLQIDTLIITGASTSGECRATAVDAITRTLNLGMVEDCLVERIGASHKNALLDVWMKFGDVVSSDEVLRYFTLWEK